jgi:hypothetical protein
LSDIADVRNKRNDSSSEDIDETDTDDVQKALFHYYPLDDEIPLQDNIAIDGNI